MRRRTPYALASLIPFALALLFQSPAPATAQKPKGGNCGGCYNRYERCQNRGTAEICYAQLVECLLSNGCPVPSSGQ